MSRVTFRVAVASDDEGIRRLLRESSMAGSVSVSFRREPNYFVAGAIGGRETTIAAEDAGRIVCAGSVAVRDRFVNGQPMPVGYLGQLRLAASHAGRFDVLRRGYAFFDSHRDTFGATVYFTSIAADNDRALRLLGRGVRGLPAYERIGDLVTMLFSTAWFFAPKLMIRPIDACSGPAPTIEPPRVAELFGEAGPGYQLAPVWTKKELDRLSSLGLPGTLWQILGVGRRADLAAALWDQRAFKQTVVTAYSPWLRRLRPLYNALTTITGGLPLPRVGDVLPQAFISPFALRDENVELLTSVLHGLGHRAKVAGIRAMTWAMDARDPRLATIRRQFRPRLYHTTLFAVTWPGDAPVPLDGRLLYPDAALL